MQVFDSLAQRIIFPSALSGTSYLSFLCCRFLVSMQSFPCSRFLICSTCKLEANESDARRASPSDRYNLQLRPHSNLSRWSLEEDLLHVGFPLPWQCRTLQNAGTEQTAIWRQQAILNSQRWRLNLVLFAESVRDISLNVCLWCLHLSSLCKHPPWHSRPFQEAVGACFDRPVRKKPYFHYTGPCASQNSGTPRRKLLDSRPLFSKGKMYTMKSPYLYKHNSNSLLAESCSSEFIFLNFTNLAFLDRGAITCLWNELHSHAQDPPQICSLTPSAHFISSLKPYHWTCSFCSWLRFERQLPTLIYSGFSSKSSKKASLCSFLWILK